MRIHRETTYRTIDLFAGIGGIRLGFEQTGRTQTVFGAEIDPHARKTYRANFGDDLACDVTQIDTAELPDFDLLLAGFPCQAFSIAGRRGGFEDTRGTLFFHVARILRDRRPRAFLLENVKGLTHHDRGRTLATILKALDELDYEVRHRLLNSKDYGVPQNRERIYLVGFDRRRGNHAADFEFPEPAAVSPCLRDVLEAQPVSGKYYLSARYLETLKRHRKRHESKGNGFGFEILDPTGIANAVVCGGMGRERNLVVDERLTDFDPPTRKAGGLNREFVRILTPREWARLQGYPETFVIPVSDTQAYRQFGNSVSVPVIRAIAERLLDVLDGR